MESGSSDSLGTVLVLETRLFETSEFNPPACIGNTACIRGPASIRSITISYTFERVPLMQLLAYSDLVPFLNLYIHYCQQ